MLDSRLMRPSEEGWSTAIGRFDLFNMQDESIEDDYRDVRSWRIVCRSSERWSCAAGIKHGCTRHSSMICPETKRLIHAASAGSYRRSPYCDVVCTLGSKSLQILVAFFDPGVDDGCSGGVRVQFPAMLGRTIGANFFAILVIKQDTWHTIGKIRSEICPINSQFGSMVAR